MTVDTVTVVLSGEFDFTGEGFLSGRLEQICRTRPSRRIFETAQVAFLDCSSARLIAGTSSWLPPGTRPVVSRPSPVVRRVLRASGLGRFCEFQFGD